MDFETGVKLKNLGSFKIGGEARFFKRATTLEDLINTVEDAKKRRLPFFILGDAMDCRSGMGVGLSLSLLPAFEKLLLCCPEYVLRAGRWIYERPCRI